MSGIRTRSIKNLGIPNMLSILRIILIPVFILLFFSNGTKSVLIAAIVLIVSGLTDILDGIIARKFNMTTALGRILDPLADKLTQASVCICLVVKKVAPVWLLLLLILKEVLMIAGGAKLITKGKRLTSSRWFGKLSTVVFYVVMISIIIFKFDRRVTDTLLIIALGFMFFSFIMYIPIFRRLVSNSETGPKSTEEK